MRLIIQITIKDGLQGQFSKELESSQTEDWDEAERILKLIRKRLENKEEKEGDQDRVQDGDQDKN